MLHQFPASNFPVLREQTVRRGLTDTRTDTSENNKLLCQLLSLLIMLFRKLLCVQQRVYYNRKFCTVEELNIAITAEWQKLSQRLIG